MIDIFLNPRCKPASHTKHILPDINETKGLLHKQPNHILSKLHRNNVYQQHLSILFSNKKIPPSFENYSHQLIKSHHEKLQPQIYDYVVVNTLKNPLKAKRTNTACTQKTHRIRNKSTEDQQPIHQIKSNKITQFTFVIDQGNNNEPLVKSILQSRLIWKQAKWGQQVPNFKWLFFKSKNNYQKINNLHKIKSTNHFEFNQQLTRKDLLIKNLQIYCQTKKIQLFTITPITFIIDFDDQYCQYNLKQFLNFYLKNDPRKTNRKPNNNQNYQIIYNFTHKLSDYMAFQNSQLKKNINSLSKPINNTTFNTQQSYLWLLKPTGLNRGRGIEIFDQIEQLQKYLLDYMTLMNRRNIFERKKSNIESQSYVGESKISSQKFRLNTCSFVLQKYIQKPFLINSRKFDIRIWILLTHNLKLYIFKQGYIRTSTEIFSTQNINNYFIHLTNNAIQKNSQNYGQYQNGNQLSFQQLQKYIQQQKVLQIWQKIKQTSYMVFSSVKKKINQNNRKNCFEIFGLDYIIDQQLKVWLIEVNENPCIECSSPLLNQLIPRMINDAFKLTIDQIFTQLKPQDVAYPVTGYCNNQNLWDNIGLLVPNAEYNRKKQ